MELAQDMGRGNSCALGRRSRVRLHEIGPRLELEVLKVRRAGRRAGGPVMGVIVCGVKICCLGVGAYKGWEASPLLATSCLSLPPPCHFVLKPPPSLPPRA